MCLFVVSADFSAERMTTVKPLLERAIDRFLWWKTLRDQLSTFRTHDPGTVCFAVAAFRSLSSSVVPRKHVVGMFLGVLADQLDGERDA